MLLAEWHESFVFPISWNWGLVQIFTRVEPIGDRWEGLVAAVYLYLLSWRFKREATMHFFKPEHKFSSIESIDPLSNHMQQTVDKVHS